MRGFWLGLSLALAFIVGCVAAPFIVPPLSAQQQGVQRWEYYSLHPNANLAALNEAGQQGWEFVGTSHTGYYVLKRPL